LLTVILPPSSFFDEPNLELTLVSTFLSFSPIATFLPKSALQDDPDIVDNSADIAGKHFNNTTLIQMDKGGGYRIVHGPKLYKKLYIAIKEKSAFLIFIDTDLIAVFICWEGLVNENPQKIKVKNQDKIDLLWCQYIFLPNMSNLSEIVKGIELGDFLFEPAILFA
jgi:hypothetical protein